MEITTLVIPGINDNEACFKQIAQRINKELGKETPWHLSAYYPSYQCDAPPTPVTTLERGRAIAIAEGLRYVYLGNVPGHPHENTYCPRCETLLIERDVFEVRAYHITAQKACPTCQEAIPMVGRLIDR